MARGDTFLQIDVSQLKNNMDALAEGLSKEQYSFALQNVVKDTGKHLKSVVDKQIRRHYDIKQRKVYEVIGDLQVSTSPEIKCILPLAGSRGTIANNCNATYRAVANIKGKHAFYTKKTKKGGTRIENRRILAQASIKKRKISRLPYHKGTESGRIHFYIPSGKLAGHVFVRKDGQKKRYPITHGVSIAIPQMALADAREGIQRETIHFMGTRIAHYHKKILDGTIKK